MDRPVKEKQAGNHPAWEPQDSGGCHRHAGEGAVQLQLEPSAGGFWDVRNWSSWFCLNIFLKLFF